MKTSPAASRGSCGGQSLDDRAAQARGSRLVVALWALVTGLLIMYLALFALVAASRLARPLEELTYGESWLLDGARQVARGQGLYTPPDQLPLVQIAYTPVYYLVVGALQGVIGDHGYAVGRAVSILATLVGAAALAWSVRTTTRSWAFGLLGAALFLTQNVTVLLWGSLERVDALALGLTLLGLALFTSGRHPASAVLFVLAFFTKQTYVVAPLAAALALWPSRSGLVRFASVVAGGVAVGILFLQWLTHGWFWWHVVTTNANQTDLDTFATLIGSFLQFNGLTVLAALASFLLPAVPAERVWRWYLVGSLLVLPSVAKLGASSNYWLEVSAATAALLAIASHHLSELRSARVLAPIVLAGALLIAVPAYQATTTDLGDTAVDLIHPPTPRYLSLVSDIGLAPYRVDSAFIDLVAHEPGPLLTDNSGLAAAAGKPIEYEFQIFQLLRVEGYWSEQPILDAVAARRFSLVALMHPLDGPADGTRWSPALRAALLSAYAAAGSQAGFWLYRPSAAP